MSSKSDKKQPEQPTAGADALSGTEERTYTPSASPVMNPDRLRQVADSINGSVEANRPSQPPQRGIVQIDF